MGSRSLISAWRGAFSPTTRAYEKGTKKTEAQDVMYRRCIEQRHASKRRNARLNLRAILVTDEIQEVGDAIARKWKMAGAAGIKPNPSPKTARVC